MELHWIKRVLSIALTLVALGWAFNTTYTQLVQIWWESAAYNHCVLIIPIAVYLAWLERARWVNLVPDISYAGAMLAVAGSLLWVCGEVLLINFFQHLAAVLVVIGALWAWLGNRIARVLWFPLLYLLFMVPEGEFLVPYLQDWTATVVVTLLRITEIPVFLEGRYLQIPTGNFEVARACSGINYLIATLAVGSVFAYLQFHSIWRRGLFMLLAIAVPLLANGARAYGIVMIAHLSDYKYAMGIDHFIYGWVFFGLVIFLLFAVGALFSDAGQPNDAQPASVAAARHGRSGLHSLLVSLILLLSAVLPGVLAARLAELPDSTVVPALTSVEHWRGPTDYSASLHGHFKGATAELQADYTNADNTSISLEVALYSSQRHGSEFVNQSNRVFDPEMWRLTESESVIDPAVSGLAQVQQRVVARGTQKRVIWWWYLIGDHYTSNGISAKLRYGLEKLRGNTPYGGVVVISGDAAASNALAVESMRKFLSSALADRGLLSWQ